LKPAIRNLHLPGTSEHLQLRRDFAQADASAAQIEACESDGVCVARLEDFLEGAKTFLATAWGTWAMG
jgi:hypothetical protein